MVLTRHHGMIGRLQPNHWKTVFCAQSCGMAFNALIQVYSSERLKLEPFIMMETLPSWESRCSNCHVHFFHLQLWDGINLPSKVRYL